MSTKIYTGYKLEGIRTVKELDAFNKRLFIKVRTAQESMVVSKVASLASEFYDKHTLGWVLKKKRNKHKDDSPLTYAFMKMMEKQREIKKTVGYRTSIFSSR